MDKLHLEAALCEVDKSASICNGTGKDDVKRILRVLCGVKEKKKKEETYSVGEWFESNANRHLLAQVAYGKVCLIELSSGNRRNNPIEVDIIHEITQEEFDRICGDHKYTRIESDE